MSVVKLLSRIVAPSDVDMRHGGNGLESHPEEGHALSLHDHTYGITSDPLTQFACAFSALIHDVGTSPFTESLLLDDTLDFSH